jgi:serine/threonine protein kinase
MKLAFEVLQGLEYLNKNRVCHRNLKLENILFDPEVSIFYHSRQYKIHLAYVKGTPVRFKGVKTENFSVLYIYQS